MTDRARGRAAGPPGGGRSRWKRTRRHRLDRDNVAQHAGEWCGLSVDERAALVAIEAMTVELDPAFALRLAGGRMRRLRAWFLSSGGTTAGASLLAVGAVGAVWSAWFGLLLAAGSVPAMVDVIESSRRRRARVPSARADRATG